MPAQSDGPLEDGAPGCLTGCRVGSGGDDGPGIAVGGESARGSTVVSIVPGGRLRAPVKVRDVPPVYPDLARRTGIEGAVGIECRIDETGAVVGATVLFGSPLLSPAALTAVREWRYVPTLLNGVPVRVVMSVTVNFRLRR